MASHRILRHPNGITIVLSTNMLDRIVQGVPTQAQVIAPPIPARSKLHFPAHTYLNRLSLKNIDVLDYAVQHAAAGPARASLDECPHQVPIFNKHTREILRQTAT